MKMNNKGIVTVDFIFAMTIALGMSVVLFSISFTLVVVEMTQYVVYASSRAHSVAHINKSLQVKQAVDKYTELINNEIFKPLYTNGWFKIPSPDQIEIKSAGQGDVDFSDEYTNTRVPYTGVRIDFTASMLDFNVPFIGKTAEDDGGFKTKITAFLIREPTTEECLQFMKERFQVIKTRDSRFQNNPIVDNIYDEMTNSMEDNGC